MVQRMKHRENKLILTLATLLVGCSADVFTTTESDAGDAAPQVDVATVVDAAHLEAAKPEAATDAGAPDAELDVWQPPPPPTHTTCPFLAGPKECGDASAYQVRKNDAGIWTGCSYSSPPCPSGWQCAGLNAQNSPEFHVCP